MLKHKLVNRKLLLVFFVVLLINWVMIILSTRINDVTLSDTLGLFSLLPSGYIVSLFVLVFLTAVSIYLHENVAAILFAGLFALYFSGTPWIIEPLRVPDAIAHFSGAALVAISGHMPPTSNYYFDYPGSSLFGSSFLLITGLNSILVLKVFPLLIMAIFYLNFSVLIHSIFKDSRVVSLGLLVASIFGYGAMHFSPAGIAQMLFPLMLFTVGRKKYSVCFFVLTFSLVILNPTICAFLACTLFLYLTVLRLMELRINRIVLYEAVFFAFTFLSWTLYNSPRVLFQIGDFIRQLLDFSFGKGTIQGLSPPISPLVGLSVARRIFVGLSGILVAVILLFAMSLFVKRRRARPRVSQYVGDMIGPSMILVGLALTLLFFIAVPSNPFGSRGISLYLLGASLSVGFFNLKSGKTLLLLTILLSSLIIPAFIFAYPQEQSDITRDRKSVV